MLRVLPQARLQPLLRQLQLTLVVCRAASRFAFANAVRRPRSADERIDEPTEISELFGDVVAGAAGAGAPRCIFVGG